MPISLYKKGAIKMNRDILDKEFEPSQIKRRRGAFGAELDYVETADVIRRLNDSFDAQWSFEIVEYREMFDEVVVLGRLTAEGIVKSQFGSHKITRTKKDGEVVNIGYDLKAATSDSLKKCATGLGVALHLYSENIADEPREPVNRNAMTPSESDETISKEKLAEIKQLRTKLKWTPEDVMDHAERLFNTRDIAKLNPVMGDAFIAYLKAQNEKPAA
jgi:hypothetical protein